VIHLVRVEGENPKSMVSPIEQGQKLYFCVKVFKDKDGCLDGRLCTKRHRWPNPAEKVWLRSRWVSKKRMDFWAETYPMNDVHPLEESAFDLAH
jgi:hypothetical protein